MMTKKQLIIAILIAVFFASTLDVAGVATHF
jgi:hypothetical protein